MEALEDRTLLSTSIPLNASTWSLVGPAPISAGSTPFAGRITGLAASPNDANTIYVAAAGGGVWKTTNGGGSWTPLTDSQATTTMGAIAVAPNDPNVIYAGTGDPNNAIDSFYGRGILKSTDAGATWTLITGNEGGTEFDRRTISKIVIDPQNDNIVYVAVAGAGVQGLSGNTGIWKTTDGGTTWTNTTTLISTTAAYSDLIMDPTTSSTLYMAVGSPFGAAANGIYKTMDFGSTWQPLTGRLPRGTAAGRAALAISQTNSPQVIYASFSDPVTGGLGKLMNSKNGGTTWNDLTPFMLNNGLNYMGSQGWYDTTLAVDLHDANIVYAGGQDSLLRSTDGGNTWTDQAFSFNGPHPDHHAIGFDVNGKLLDGNDGGIWRLDQPDSWSDLNGNLSITQFVGVALHPTNPNIAYGGSRGNGTEKFTDSSVWNQQERGEGGRMRIDGGHPDTVFHTSIYLPGNNADFFRKSNDGGVTWTTANTGINLSDPANVYVPYVIDSADSSRLLLGTNTVYETDDQANTWLAISAPGVGGWTASGAIDAVAAAPTDVNTVYATVGTQIFHTSDHGFSWSSSTLPTTFKGSRYSDLKVDPADSQTLYLSTSTFRADVGTGQVWISHDGGATWADESGNSNSGGLPDMPANTILLDPWSKVLYVGTDTGVYASNNYNSANPTWMRMGAGMPNVRVTDLELNTVQLQLFSKGYVLGAGTYGRGLWEIATAHFAVAPLPPTVTAGAPMNVTIQALDPFNQPIVGYTGVFTGTVTLANTDALATVNGVKAPLTFSFTTQDADQHVLSNVIFHTAGQQTITISDPTDNVGSATASVQVLPGAVDHFTVTGPTTVAAGVAFSVTVTALDSSGNTVAGYLGTVHFTSSDGLALLPSDGGLVNGVGTFQVTLKTAGTQSVTVTDTVNGALFGTRSPITVTAGVTTHLRIDGPAGSVAGAAFTLTISARDAFENLVSAYRGTVQFTSGDTQAVLPPFYTFTATDSGAHTFTTAVTLKTAGAQTVQATDTLPSTIFGRATVVVSPAAASSFRVTAPAGSTAGQAIALTVTALDAFGNTATGYTGTVHFTSSDRQATLPLNSTLSSGTAVFSVTLATAGSQTVTATDTLAGAITGSATVSVSASVLDHFSITAPGTSTAGGTFSITVVALDRFTNVVTTYGGTVTFSSSDARAVLPSNYSFLASDAGAHTFSGVALDTAGSQSIIATDTVSAGIVGSASVLVNPAAAVSFQISGPASTTAGVAFAATVTALDTFGNTATGYLGTIRFTSTDPLAVLPGSGALVRGTASFSVTFKTAGPEQLTATDTIFPSISGSTTLAVLAAAASHFNVLAPSASVAGTALNMTVTALDAFNNIATGYLGTLARFGSSDGQAVLPGSYTFAPADAGSHTFPGAVTLKTAGSQTITATDSTGLIAGSTNVTVSPAAVAQFVVGTPASTIAGVAFSVTVSAFDRFGNLATGYLGSVGFSSSDTLATLPAVYTFLGVDSGSHLFIGGATLDRGGSQTVTVTETATRVSGSTTLLVLGATATHFSVGAPANDTAGSPFSVTVTALDRFGNIAHDYRGQVFFMASRTASVPANYIFTNSDSGVHTFTNGVSLPGSLSQTPAFDLQVTATDTASSITTGSTTVHVVPAPAARFTVSASANARSGAAVTLTVTALDQFGNVVLGYRGSVHVTASDGSATLPLTYTYLVGDSGIHAFTNQLRLRTLGSQTLTATDTASASVTGSTALTVQPHGSPGIVVTGSDAGSPPEVRVFDRIAGTTKLDFMAYNPAFTGGVRVALADINDDGIEDIITVPGPGGGPDIRVFDGATGVMIREIVGYFPFFTGGLYVAAADINGDDRAEIITGPDATGGPDVRVFSGTNGILYQEFMAYNPTFTGGVRVASGDVTGDGVPDIITAAGPGGGPHVKVFRGVDLTVVQSFMAYNIAFTGGVYVASGDTNGDGFADVITGAGAGGGPHVKVFSGKDNSILQSFFAYAGTFTGGVRVGAADINGDGKTDILTAPGAGTNLQVESFSGAGSAAALDDFFAFSQGLPGGVFVGGH